MIAIKKKIEMTQPLFIMQSKGHFIHHEVRYPGVNPHVSEYSTFFFLGGGGFVLFLTLFVNRVYGE